MWYQTLFVYLSAIPAALSLLFIDVGTFSFNDVGASGVRIVSFDTQKQQLLSVHYIPNTNKRAPNRKAFENELLSTNFQGHVTLKKKINPQDVAIRTFGHLENGQQQSPLPTHIDPLTFISALPNLTHPSKTVIMAYQGNHGLENRDFSCLSPSQNSNRKERGILGELVTDLTFLSLGCVKINGQNLSNQGLDGIFWHPKRKLLILTESKCRSESKSAQKYLEEDLSDAKIVARLREIDNQKTRTTLIEYVDSHLSNTHTLAQRLTSSGFVESALGKLDPILYIYYRYPDLSKAPKSIKDTFLKNVLERLNMKKMTYACYEQPNFSKTFQPVQEIFLQVILRCFSMKEITQKKIRCNA